MPVDGLAVEQDFVGFRTALSAAGAGLFAASGAPVFAARAPGRLDVMGGFADYSGSLVAEMPLRQAAVVGAQRDDASEGAVTVFTANADEADLTARVELPAELFINPVSLLRWVREAPEASRWAGYVAGAFSILRAEGLLPRRVGARIFVRSDIPIGAGVAAGAAIGVATMHALCAAFAIPMTDGLTLARLCQRIENEIIDLPASIVDPATVTLSEADSLFLLLCQPCQVQGNLPLPAGWSIFGIDSGIKRRDSLYNRIRTAAFMGYKVLADRAGNGFGGYLCNLTPDAYRALQPERLPATMTGAAFLGEHGGIFDTATSVAPGETYPVRAAAEHAIQEMARVTRFAECLREGSEGALLEAGIQMLGSHDSYGVCGLGAKETDLLVADASRYDSVAGARITGTGGGGTVCILCRTDSADRIARSIADEYQARTGNTAQILQGTSPGAMATPVRKFPVGS